MRLRSVKYFNLCTTPASAHKPARAISACKGCDTSKDNVPSEREAGKSPEVEVQSKPEKHSGHGPELRRGPGKNSQKEDSEERPIRDRSDRQAHFKHSASPAGEQSEQK